MSLNSASLRGAQNYPFWHAPRPFDFVYSLFIRSSIPLGGTIAELHQEEKTDTLHSQRGLKRATAKTCPGGKRQEQVLPFVQLKTYHTPLDFKILLPKQPFSFPKAALAPQYSGFLFVQDRLSKTCIF